MKNLSLGNLQQADHLLSPSQLPALTLNDSALVLLNNARIDYHVPAVLARAGLLSEEVSAKLVVDSSHHLVGVIMREQVSEQNILRLQSENRVTRDDILVKDVMHPRALLLAADYAEIKTATVGDVISAMRKAGENQLLVRDPISHEIHGMIAMADIIQRLHKDVVVEKPPTVLNLCSLQTQ